jgi:hypothetical protein
MTGWAPAAAAALAAPPASVGYVADLLARYLGASSVRITGALALLVGALYARRALGIGHVLGKWVTIGAIVAVVLAIGIASGALSPNIEVARGYIVSGYDLLRGLITSVA